MSNYCSVTRHVHSCQIERHGLQELTKVVCDSLCFGLSVRSLDICQFNVEDFWITDLPNLGVAFFGDCPYFGQPEFDLLRVCRFAVLSEEGAQGVYHKRNMLSLYSEVASIFIKVQKRKVQILCQFMKYCSMHSPLVSQWFKSFFYGRNQFVP